MESFYIDKIGCDADNKDDKTVISDSDDGDDILSDKKLDLLGDLQDILVPKKRPKRKDVFSLNNTYLITNYKNLSNEENVFSNAETLKKCSLKPGLEKRHRLLPSEKSKKTLKLKRKKLRKKTKGKEWFNMKAAEITEEVKNDFELLKMRSVLDKSHVYKKNDITRMPKYFQIGRVIESPADFYNGRIPKSQRKKTMVEELLADAEFKKYQKKKFKEIMDDNRRKKRNQIKKNKEKSKIKKKTPKQQHSKNKKV